MSEVSYSPIALEDLDQIWDYVAKDSVLQANNLTLRFREKLHHIANNNLIGHPRPNWRTNSAATQWAAICSFTVRHSSASNWSG